MSKTYCRSSVARAAVLILLFSCGLAEAQIVIIAGPPREPGGLVNDIVTGVQYDRLNQVKAERRLNFLQSKLRRDSEGGHAEAAERDVRRIDRDRYRIAVNDWLIRKNSLEDLGYYPIRTDDPYSCAAIANVARPAEFAAPPQGSELTRASLAPAPPNATPTTTPPPTPNPTPTSTTSTQPTIALTLVNAEPAGADIAFTIDGVAYRAAGGSRQDLTVAPDANILFDGGGSVGQRRYQLSPGPYEFRTTAEGWALYKLGDKS